MVHSVVTALFYSHISKSQTVATQRACSDLVPEPLGYRINRCAPHCLAVQVIWKPTGSSWRKTVYRI